MLPRKSSKGLLHRILKPDYIDDEDNYVFETPESKRRIKSIVAVLPSVCFLIVALCVLFLSAIL